MLEPTIGIEVHVELKSKNKVFSKNKKFWWWIVYNENTIWCKDRK